MFNIAEYRLESQIPACCLTRTDVKKTRGIRLVGPTRKDPCWQAKIPEAFDRSKFDVNYQTKTATCPEGKTPASWLEYEDDSRGRFISARFSRADCQRAITGFSAPKARAGISCSVPKSRRRPLPRHVSLWSPTRERSCISYALAWKRPSRKARA